MALDQHSLQSPFLFDVYQKALNRKSRHSIFSEEIEMLRNSLLNDHGTISTNSYGTGTKLPVSVPNRIKAIAKSGISSREDSEVLVNLIKYSGSTKILELGTSLGINTCYLSQVPDVQRIVSVEGNAELVRCAHQNLDQLNGDHVELICADIDKFILQHDEQYDLIYIDANHTFEATCRYFEFSSNHISTEGIIVIDDINWTPDMLDAWNWIKSSYPQHAYIENAKTGIVFVNRKLIENQYILNF